MNIFVTGGTGFIGSHLISLALKRGHTVKALRRPGSTPKLPISNEVKWIEESLHEINPEQFFEIDSFIHLAATGVDVSTSTWSECFATNVVASNKVWRTAAQGGVKKYIICGSCFEYGASGNQYEFIPPDAPLLPTGIYHASKAAASAAAIAFAAEFKTDVSILRPFHVYGPGEMSNRFWPQLVAAAQSGKNFQMSSGIQIRDFSFVSAISDKLLSAAETDVITQRVEIRNLGSGNPQSLINFAREEWRRLDAKGTILDGVISMRENEVLRYVPDIEKKLVFKV